jgi:hypothetical protein
VKLAASMKHVMTVNSEGISCVSADALPISFHILNPKKKSGLKKFIYPEKPADE